MNGADALVVTEGRRHGDLTALNSVLLRARRGAVGRPRRRSGVHRSHSGRLPEEPTPHDIFADENLP